MSPRVNSILVSKYSLKTPLIDRFYYRFLDDRNAAAFLAAVTQSYSMATLSRLIENGDRTSRRGAVLAMTMAGGHSAVRHVGEALRDADRAVRVIAEDGISELWQKAGSHDQQQRLHDAVRLNESREFERARDGLDELIQANACFGEVWYQRGIANAGLGEHLEAIDDWQQAVEFEPHHFRATLRMADSFLKLRDLNRSATCLQWTLRIYPRCETARARLQRIERLLGEQTDR